jgi:hypothetical protein
LTPAVAPPYDDLAVMPLPPGGSWLAGLPAGRVRHNVVWLLELAKEVQELVGWLVASGRGSWWCGPGYGVFLESHVGVQVDACSGWVFVT